jgi:hypothetical protein
MFERPKFEERAQERHLGDTVELLLELERDVAFHLLRRRDQARA